MPVHFLNFFINDFTISTNDLWYEIKVISTWICIPENIGFHLSSYFSGRQKYRDY